jgi:hypothetical protein
VQQYDAQPPPGRGRLGVDAVREKHAVLRVVQSERNVRLTNSSVPLWFVEHCELVRENDEFF